MTLIKKIDVEEHLAQRRGSRTDAALFLVHSNATASPGTESAKATPAVQHIARDCAQNQSSSSAPRRPFLIVAESDRNRSV